MSNATTRPTCCAACVEGTPHVQRLVTTSWGHERHVWLCRRCDAFKARLGHLPTCTGPSGAHRTGARIRPATFEERASRCSPGLRMGAAGLLTY